MNLIPGGILLPGANQERRGLVKILKLAYHCCIRVVKEAMPLISRGHQVHVAASKVTQYSDHFSSIAVYHDMNQLVEIIKLHADADVIHCHNEPSWFVSVAKEVFPDKPVVLDVHDSMLLRRTDESVCEAKNQEIYRHTCDERNNFQLADGLVFVGPAMRDIVIPEYGLTQPHCVIPSALPERFYRVDFGKWQGGLVYEGRIDIEKELGAKWNFFQYANYVPLANACRQIGMDFHIYTPRKSPEVRKVYEPVCYLHDPLGVRELVKALGGHDWGLVGNLGEHEAWKHAIPNKLFEYFGGCLPVVCMNADEAWNYIKDIGVGIKVDSVDELAHRWAEHRECRQNVVKYRSEFVMERHIGKLEDLYRKLV